MKRLQGIVRNNSTQSVAIENKPDGLLSKRERSEDFEKKVWIYH